MLVQNLGMLNLMVHQLLRCNFLSKWDGIRFKAAENSWYSVQTYQDEGTHAPRGVTILRTRCPL